MRVENRPKYEFATGELTYRFAAEFLSQWLWAVARAGGPTPPSWGNESAFKADLTRWAGILNWIAEDNETSEYDEADLKEFIANFEEIERG